MVIVFLTPLGSENPLNSIEFTGPRGGGLAPFPLNTLQDNAHAKL